MRKSILFGAASILLAGTAAAQNGTDTCTTPTAVGEGSFAFDTTTMVGSQEMTCLSAYAFNQDMFWVYTATVAGDIVFDTEGSGFDTQLGIYSGTDCTASCVDDDDDSGTGLLSSITVTGVSIGDQFVVQVGGFGSGAGAGVLNIAAFVDPCAGFPDDGFEDNDDCATATPMADGTYTGLAVTGSDKDHYAFCVADGATVTIDLIFTNANGDIDGFLRDAAAVECGTGNGVNELADGFSASDNENIVWTNSTGSDLNVVLEVNVWTGSSSQCNNYDMTITGSGCGPTSVGTPFCDPMDPNSTTMSTALIGTLGTGVESGLRLEASNGVPSEFGYFLIGTGVDDPGIVISNGRLCLAVTGGNQFGRYNFGTTTNSIGAFDAAGDFQNLVGTATSNGGYGYDVATSNPLGGTIMSGSTWHFQLWHRDTPAGAGSSNFSNGLSVTFP